mgnify:CR=1 FL=1
MKKLNIKVLALSTLMLSMSQVNAQNVDKNEVTFNYIQLPLTPIANKVKNYEVAVVQNAEAKNAEKKADYEKKKKEADEKYDKELKAQEDQRNSQKSKVGSLMVSMQQMDESNKVKKDVVPEPVYLKVYPVETVAGKVNIEGLTKSNTNAAKVTVTLVGFEVSEPTISTSGQSPNISYKYTVDYKNPISVQVESEGTINLDELIPGTDKTLSYNNGKSFKSEGEARSDWATTSKSTQEQLMNSSFEKGMTYTNQYLSNKIGFMKKEREALLFMVKDKKVDYSDYADAFTSLNDGLLMLGEDLLIEEGKTKIKDGVTKFETILKESNVKDKKARVNEDVTIAIYFNLLEANIWLNDFVTAQKYILKLKTSNTSNREEKRMARIKELMDDLKVRYDANNPKQ